MKIYTFCDFVYDIMIFFLIGQVNYNISIESYVISFGLKQWLGWEVLV